MNMLVNGQKVNVYGVKTTWISKNRSGIGDYTATVKFCTNKMLTDYERQCVGEYIDFLLDNGPELKPSAT